MGGQKSTQKFTSLFYSLVPDISNNNTQIFKQGTVATELREERSMNKVMEKNCFAYKLIWSNIDDDLFSS